MPTHVTPSIAATAACLSLAVACGQGATSPGHLASPVAVLQPRYVLTHVNGSAIPYVMVNDAQDGRVRLLGDTLRFSGFGPAPIDSGSYLETRVLGVQRPGGVETVTLLTLGTRRWLLADGGTLELSGFAGAANAVGTVTMRLGNADAPSDPVTVGAGLFLYTFVPR
jgi:hypothetical protein